MSNTPGYTLERRRTIHELDGAMALTYRHDATGARILSIVNNDENKVFGISFRTPPHDSTGVAHILEHSVLCGSRKYPVKEPFVELLKGSLQTFLNAFTFPDKTCYPVASANEQDFYNLIDVYLDAVFFPRIDEWIFRQEGWHYEPAEDREGLIYKGVVFNEMKGAYSSPESLLSEYSQQSVFPDVTYGLDSGGHPQVIPNLTYAQFKNFHDTYYHPSNAWIYFYGNDDPARRLEALRPYLDSFAGPVQADSEVALQPRFSEPRRLVKPYEPGQDRTTSLVTVNWLLNEACEVQANFAMHMLEELLIGMPSSPLRKALMDSGLGEDLAGIGLEEDLRQMYFSTGLKGVRAEDVDKVETLILQTLEKIAAQGVEPEMIEAAVNTVEFALRENNPGRFPRGLVLMIRSLSTWLYGGDELALLTFAEPLAKLKARLAAGEPVFEELIRTMFLDNSHRTTLVLEPDAGLGASREKAEQARLMEAFQTMDAAAREDVAEVAATLTRMQETPDSPEALASIPMLTVADLPKENTVIPLESGKLEGAGLMTHPLATSGIVYLDLGFNVRNLPLELLPLTQLFGRAMVELGTRTLDDVAITRRIAAKTGGIAPATLSTPVHGSRAPSTWLFLRAKATAEKMADLTAILGEILGGVNFANRERFRQMVLEEKARAEQRLIPAGHALVAGRLKARFHPAAYADELMHGVENLFALRRLAERVETEWEGVRADLERVQDILFRRCEMLANVTCDPGDMDRFLNLLGQGLGAAPDSEAETPTWRMPELPAREGLGIPAQVNYVGKAADLQAGGVAYDATAMAVTRYLRTAYLWDKVRVQGGAYGAFCMFDDLSGQLAMVSYRDPNLERTLKAFDGAAGYLRGLELSAEELNKAVVGAVGDFDAYMLPDAKGWTSMVRTLRDRSDAERQAMRERIMSATAKDFRAFADALDYLASSGQVVVLGAGENLERAKTAGLLEDVTRLL